MDANAYSRRVAEDARSHASAALSRRRPDLDADAAADSGVPSDESAQFVLDELAFTQQVVDRLLADIKSLIVSARAEGASWSRVGLAIHESPQTTFNRYSRFDPEGARPGRTANADDAPQPTPSPPRRTPKASRPTPGSASRARARTDR